MRAIWWWESEKLVFVDLRVLSWDWEGIIDLVLQYGEEQVTCIGFLLRKALQLVEWAVWLIFMATGMFGNVLREFEGSGRAWEIDFLYCSLLKCCPFAPRT